MTQNQIPQERDPAVRSYFFGPGYTDMKLLAVQAKEPGLQVASEFYGKAIDACAHAKRTTFNKVTFAWHCVNALGWAACALFCCIATVLTLTAILLLHGLILGSSTILLMFVIGLIRASDKVWRVLKHVHYSCSGCGQENTMPVFLCPSCGCKHRHLYSGMDGVTRRFCQCGANLPVVHHLGRKLLHCECAKCETRLVTPDVREDDRPRNWRLRERLASPVLGLRFVFWSLIVLLSLAVCVQAISIYQATNHISQVQRPRPR